MNPAVFSVLADPTRRRILEHLGNDGPRTATQLAAELGISRQATAKHLALLGQAGLASSNRVGRETRFAAELDALLEVTAWIDTVRGDWKQRLDLLAASFEPGTD